MDLCNVVEIEAKEIYTGFNISKSLCLCLTNIGDDNLLLKLIYGEILNVVVEQTYLRFVIDNNSNNLKDKIRIKQIRGINIYLY